MLKNSCYIFVILMLSTLIFAQPFVIDGATIRGKGGRETHLMRPTASSEDWWYSEVVECIHDVGCVDIVFCVDTSGSMAGTINSLQDDIDRFAYDIAAVGFDPRFGLVTYSETVSFPHGSTLEDIATFSSILDEARSGDGGYEHHSDAIYQSIDHFDWRPGCEHVIVLITDECDDASTVSASATISQIISWGGTVYMLTADCGDVDDFRDYCDTSYGRWFDYSSSSLSDVFDQIVDDIADVVEIDITITNTSGSVLNPVTAELVPDFCITVGDSPNPQSYGPIPASGSHTFLWDITEIPGCSGWGDCFVIRVTSGSYVDSIVGCLFVEDCGCPGPEARIICPPYSGLWTACVDQYIEIEYEGYLGVDPNTICIQVEGTTYCYPSSPNLTWTSGIRGGTLRFTPSAPGWSHLQEVEMACVSGEDATGCEQLFFPETDFKVDIQPPHPIYWEHHDATLWPLHAAWREPHDGSVSFSPPCGSTLDSTDHIVVSALLYDDGVGMTPLDLMLRDLDASELAGLDFVGLWTSLTSVRITVNDIPFIPDAPVPGHFSRTVDLDATTYLLDPPSWFGGWAVACTIRADSAGILGLAFLTGEIEICIEANDLVEADGCMPCENDTEWCCTYYLAGELPLIADAGPDKYICITTSATIGGTPPAGGGVPPYIYSWSPGTDLSSTTAGNPTASPTSTTTYILTVTDDASATDSDTMTVYVSDPSADAGGDTTICPGASLPLGGSPTGSGGFGPLTYLWTPAGGLSDPSAANPWFSSDFSWGDTIITLTVTVTDTLGCEATDIVVITISPIIPDAGADVRICVGSPVTLGGSPTASGGVGPYTYSWYEYPGGTTFSTDANPVVSPVDTTTYVVHIYGGDPYCSAIDTVVVYPVQPVADAGVDTAVCSGAPIYIGGSPTGSGSIAPYTYDWSSEPPGFSSFEANPSISPNSSTIYVVMVVDSLGCIDYDSVYIDVAASPYGWVQIPSPCDGITSCEFQEIVWTVTDSTSPIDHSSIEVLVDGSTYTSLSPQIDIIDFGIDSTTVSFIPSMPWTHGSTVIFELTNVANLIGCTGSIAECSFIVDIEPPMPDPPVPPDGSVLFASPDSVGVFISDAPAGVDPASFDSISIEINGIPAMGWTYSWDGGYLSFDGLGLDAGDSVVICLDSLYDAPTYDYCAPNDTSFCWWFMVLPCDLEVTAYPDTILCGGGTIGLSVDVVGGSGFLTYSWNPATGLDDATIPNPTAIVNSTINYVITVYDESLACSMSDTASIIVSDPIADAGPDGVICPFNSVPLGCVPVATGGFAPYTYEWLDLGGTPLYTEEHPTHVFGATGESFVLHVIDSLGCEAWDTVTFDIDFTEMTTLDLITPSPGETLAVGGAYFEWSVTPPGSYLYDFILDGTTIFSRIDSAHVTVDFPCGESHYWEILAYNECMEIYTACGETTTTVYIDTMMSGDPIFYTSECTEPYPVAVHVPDGDWTACDPDSIVAFIIDSAGIIESTISMTVNGIRYHTTDLEVEWDGDSTLVFRPATMWADGETVSVCVDSAINIDDVPLIAPVCWEFYIDRSAPEIVSISPVPGSEIPPTTDMITICVRDDLSGLDSVYVTLDGIDYAFGPFGCVDTAVCFEIVMIPPLPSGDTIDVDVTRMTDCPDWCGPNVGDSSWIFIVSSCDLTVTAYPDTGLCLADSLHFEAIVTGGSGAYSCHWWPEAMFADPLECNPTGWVNSTGWARVVVTDDSMWCFAEDSVFLILSELAIGAGPDGHICPGATITLGCDPVASGGIEPYSYSWQFTDGTEFSSLPNPDYTFADTSVTFIIEVIDSIGCVEYDTVEFVIDYEPITAINLISPTGVPVPPGDVYFEWEPIPGGIDAIYDFYIDGATLFSRIDSTHVSVPFPCGETHGWGVRGYTSCEEVYIACAGDTTFTSVFDTALSANPAFYTSPCGVPSAIYLHVPNGDWTACDPDSIVWLIVDSAGIVESSIEVRVNGATFTTADGELTWDGASRLRFDPSPMWPSGTTVQACLTAVMNIDSVWLPDSVCGEFYVDLDPPVAWGIDPAPGATVVAAGWTSLDMFIFDSLSGLDESSVVFIIDGTAFSLTDPAVTWDGDSTVSIDISALGIDCGDTVNIYITASDSPDWCDPNAMADTFTIFTASCGLTSEIIEPLPNTISACEDQEIILSISVVDLLCPVDPTTIVLNVEGIDYDITDLELDWADPILTWTPPVDWAHSTTVDVCLTDVMDTCGGSSDLLPLCWTFEIDLQPPIPTTWTPPCGSSIDAVSGADFHIVLEDGPALIESVEVSIDGVDYDLGGALIISGSNAEFTWNPVLDGGLALSPGQVFSFCVHTGDSGIAYCEPHDTIICCNYTVPTDTGIVTAEIIEPMPNTITACDDQQIVMTIYGDTVSTPETVELWAFGAHWFDYGAGGEAWADGPGGCAFGCNTSHTGKIIGYFDEYWLLNNYGHDFDWGRNKELFLASMEWLIGATPTRRALYYYDPTQPEGQPSTSGSLNYGRALDTLTAHGWTVSAVPSTTPLSEDLLDDIDVLMTGNIRIDGARVFTSSDAAVVADFVNGGGNLFAICGWLSACEDVSGMNYLISSLGVGFECANWNGTVEVNSSCPLLSTFTDIYCPIVPSSIVLQVDGVDYTVADGELVWSPDSLVFTPSVLWNHGDTVHVCLTEANDSCGAVLPSPICWEFFVDIQPPLLTELDPPCGRPIIPSMTDNWSITLTDDVAGLMPDSTAITLDGVVCPISGPATTRQRSFSFEWSPSDCGITLIPGDTVTLCVVTTDGPVDYCEPNDTIYCCDYPVVDTGGPVATIIRVPEDSISACDPESIIVELVSAYPIVESTIVLSVDGTSYRTSDYQIDWLDPYLTYKPDPEWNDHDTVYASVLVADDIFGNPCINAPLSWIFYIDRVEPISSMDEPASSYTRNLRQQVIIDVDDALAGVDPNTVILVIDGEEYTYSDFDWLPDGLGGKIRWMPDENGVEFIAGDTVNVSLSVGDAPDLCGPNIHLADYIFYVEPWTPCLVVPNPFSPTGDNINEIAIFDWPNMTTEGATIYIFTIRNVLVRSYELSVQTNYEDVIGRAWDGRDKNGLLMPQGLYLYVVESNGRVVCNGTITLLR